MAFNQENQLAHLNSGLTFHQMQGHLQNQEQVLNWHFVIILSTQSNGSFVRPLGLSTIGALVVTAPSRGLSLPHTFQLRQNAAPNHYFDGNNMTKDMGLDDGEQQLCSMYPAQQHSDYIIADYMVL